VCIFCAQGTSLREWTKKEMRRCESYHPQETAFAFLSKKIAYVGFF